MDPYTVLGVRLEGIPRVEKYSNIFNNGNSGVKSATAIGSYTSSALNV